MDTTIVVAGIVAVSTLVASLGATYLQNRQSNKRFNIELGRAIDVETRKRKWEVRSEPLLRLRNELAVMATKLEKLAKRGNAFVPIRTSEQTAEALRQDVDDWTTYVSEDHLERVLYSQFDTEIVNKVREIRNEYLDIYNTTVTSKEGLTHKQFGEAARAAEEKLRPKVVEVQELINKRLEEL